MKRRKGKREPKMKRKNGPPPPTQAHTHTQTPTTTQPIRPPLPPPMFQSHLHPISTHGMLPLSFLQDTRTTACLQFICTLENFEPSLVQHMLSEPYNFRKGELQYHRLRIRLRIALPLMIFFPSGRRRNREKITKT